MTNKKVVIDARESGTSTGRYVDKLIEYLQELKPKYDVYILAKAHRVDFFKEIAGDFKVIESNYKEFTFSEQLGFLWQIRKISADLVHFSIVQQPILYRGRVVTTMHDLTTVRFKNPLKNPIVFAFKQFVYTWVNRVVALKSSIVITPTEYVKNDVAIFARINSRKIVVTYESADPIKDKPKAYDELVDCEYIMYVGRPQPHKNLFRLVSAYTQIKKTQPKLKLILVGKKDVLYEQLEKWVNEQGVDDVVFTGFVSEGQLRWLYENCQAYVFPSLSEGFGLPPLEAMCHGAPVVASSATCIPEVCGDAAVYFDPEDVSDMSNKIRYVLEDKRTRDKLIVQGYEQVKKYSWKRMANQTLDVYDEALNK